MPAHRARHCAPCCFEWRNRRVAISGCDEALIAELADVLALDPHPHRDTDDIDIAITGGGANTKVLQNASVFCPHGHPDLLIHVATLISAAFVNKARFPNLMHAAGFLAGAGATLISGPAYSGKSNLTFLAWSCGHRILGDDWLIYSPETPEVCPVPKPIKPRVRPDDYPAMAARCAGRPHAYGTFRDEHRLMVGRSDGFYNGWVEPVRVDHLVFLQKSPGRTNSIDQIDAQEALPLLLAQTLLSEATMTLRGVNFAKSLDAAGVPFFKLSIGAEAHEQAFDLMTSTLARHS